MKRDALHRIAEEIASIGTAESGPLRRERLVQLVVDHNLSLADLLAVMEIMEAWGCPVGDWATAR